MTGVNMSTIILLIASAAGLFTAAGVLSSHVKTSRLRLGDDMFNRHAEGVEKAIKEAGGGLSRRAYYAILAVLPPGLFIFGWFYMDSPAAAAVFGIAGVSVPRIIVAAMKSAHDRSFENDYLRSLEQISASLRAGASVMQAVDEVTECRFLSQGLRGQYMKLSNSIHMGTDIPEAFDRFAEDTGSADAKDFAVSLRIQTEVGGREADTAKRAADNIKDRIETRKEVKSEFSGQSSTVWIMDFTVPVMLLTFTFASSSYVESYFSGPGMAALYFAFYVCSFTGSVINHRIMNRLMEG